MRTDGTGWEDRDLSPANPVRFNVRRIVGGTRLLFTQSEPWNLLRQGRVARLKASIVDTVGGWEGVEPGPHRFGGTEFMLDGREVGHIHDFGLLDVPLVRPVGEAVVETGAAGNHHVLPTAGWVATFVDDPGDLETAIALLRLSYCWHVAKYHASAFDRSSDEILETVQDLPLDRPVAETFARTLAERTERGRTGDC